MPRSWFSTITQMQFNTRMFSLPAQIRRSTEAVKLGRLCISQKFYSNASANIARFGAYSEEG